VTCSVGDHGPDALGANCPFAEFDATETATSPGCATVRPT
jgi:hypothetical protein